MSEAERREYKAARQRLRRANYHLTDNREIMCRICESGLLAIPVGIRVCRTNETFVTCRGTCDSFQLKKEAEPLIACANCGRTQMFPDEGGYLRDGSWFCRWACRKILLKRVGIVGVR